MKSNIKTVAKLRRSHHLCHLHFSPGVGAEPDVGMDLNGHGRQVESREEAASIDDGDGAAVAHKQDTDPIDKEQDAGTHVVAYGQGVVEVDSMSNMAAGF